MQDFDKDIEECLETLRNGGVILYPTDTVWGLGCDATNPEAVEKIYTIKKRPGQKALIVLVSDEREVMQYVAAPDLAVFDYLQEAAKPTTVIYEGALGLADNLIAEDGSIAIRICREDFCRHLIRRFRKPIVSTSANLSGEPTPAVFSAVGDEIKKAVDHIVEYRQDDTTPAVPSSLIRWENGAPIVLRP